MNKRTKHGERDEASPSTPAAAAGEGLGGLLKKSPGETAMDGSNAGIDSLCQDLIGEILLRLPCLPSISSAMAVCKKWESVVHTPSFRRRYYAAHNVLVGLSAQTILPRSIFSADASSGIYLLGDGDQTVNAMAFRLPIYDCRGGRILVCIRDKNRRPRLAVCDTASRRSVVLPFFARIDFMRRAKLVISSQNDDQLFSHVIIALTFGIEFPQFVVHNVDTDCWYPLQNSGENPDLQSVELITSMLHTWQEESKMVFHFSEGRECFTSFLPDNVPAGSNHEYWMMELEDEGNVGYLTTVSLEPKECSGSLELRCWGLNVANEWVFRDAI